MAELVADPFRDAVKSPLSIWFYLVGVAGFEPATRDFAGGSQLSLWKTCVSQTSPDIALSWAVPRAALGAGSKPKACRTPWSLGVSIVP